ncbi:hypothetical protein GQF61_01955 [Sphingobacterium sp. DK4209]|nr:MULTISPECIES: hypothetical protein [unclassified Sphingobacterium]MVZ64600.1 hypothetical protein [Sphingobacterium sp. DK4209]
MELKEIKEYLSNWANLLNKKDGIKNLIDVLGKFNHFDFSIDKQLQQEAEYVHVYPGISADHKDIKFFVILDLFDKAGFKDNINSHLHICSPMSLSNQDQLGESIEDKKARKRIKRWQKNPKRYLIRKSALKHNLVRCFNVPVNDLITENNRAYFAIKKAKDNKQVDYELDLILKNLSTDQLEESTESYDTVRLVPPYPPSMENYFLLDN